MRVTFKVSLQQKVVHFILRPLWLCGFEITSLNQIILNTLKMKSPISLNQTESSHYSINKYNHLSSSFKRGFPLKYYQH